MHHHHRHHQPHSGGGGDGSNGDTNGHATAAAMMESPAADVQSMDWLMENKERIYLLAQFWQQVSETERRETE